MITDPAGRTSMSAGSSVSVTVTSTILRPIRGCVDSLRAAHWFAVGYIDVAGIRHQLPDGRVLLDDVAFRVADGAKAALVGANGAGKTTLLRIIVGDLVPQA